MTKPFLAHVFGTLLLLLFFVSVPQAHAQVGDDRVPIIDEAQSLFENGIDAFEGGRYEIASEYFMRVAEDFPLNRRTTAAMLMGGKALYRDEQYDEAYDMLERLRNEYPTSGYLDEAQRVQDLARRHAQRDDAEAEIFQLGVILPLSDDDVSFAQAFFNGVHTAVRQANESGASPIRIRFRDTENNPDVARRAVEELAAEGVDALIGPLYSREAQAAASAAQAANVVMIAPLATDKRVSDGRSHVFQANPTIEMRGRIMARYARDELNIGSFGVVSQGDNEISRQMAEGFQQEIVENGGSLEFFHELESSRGWGRIIDEVDRERFSDLEGLYLPIAGGNAPQSIRNVLNSLDEVDTPLQILGNSEWHERNVEQQASRYVATYTNDFHVDTSDENVQRFIEAYSSHYQEIPDQLTATARRLVYAGYDITNFLIERRGGNPATSLRSALYGEDSYNGLGTRIRFGEGNINDAMFIHRYRSNRIELVK